MLEAHQDRFIRSNVGNYRNAYKLVGDASSREYYRITADNVSYILCEDSQFRNIPIESYAFYIVHNLFCKEGLPVPSVYAFDNKSGLLLIQDMGDRLLEEIYDDLKLQEKKQIYSDLIDILIKIQSIPKDGGIVPFLLSFDIPKLMYEFEFFIEHALKGYFQIGFTRIEIDELLSEFLKISKILYKPELFVLNHRDFHSRNIIYYANKPYLIDFQDARLGLPQYDLVSILRDSYVQIDMDLFSFIKKYYYNQSVEKSIHEMSNSEFDYYFDIMAFQRNIKAVGTFAYQVLCKGRTAYERYMKPTLRYLKDYIHRRSELQRAGELLERYMEVD